MTKWFEQAFEIRFSLQRLWSFREMRVSYQPNQTKVSSPEEVSCATHTGRGKAKRFAHSLGLRFFLLKSIVVPPVSKKEQKEIVLLKGNLVNSG
jgi:hypothetical protein